VTSTIVARPFTFHGSFGALSIPTRTCARLGTRTASVHAVGGSTRASSTADRRKGRSERELFAGWRLDPNSQQLPHELRNLVDIVWLELTATQSSAFLVARGRIGNRHPRLRECLGEDGSDGSEDEAKFAARKSVPLRIAGRMGISVKSVIQYLRTKVGEGSLRCPICASRGRRQETDPSERGARKIG